MKHFRNLFRINLEKFGMKAVLLLFALKSLMCLLKMNVFALQLINKNKRSHLIDRVPSSM